MRTLSFRASISAILISFALVAVLVTPSGAQPPPTDGVFDAEFATPILGVDAIPGRNQVLVADTGQGIVRVKARNSRLVTFLPGVSDIHAINGNRMFAITGEPPEEEIGGEQLQGPPPGPQALHFVWARGTRTQQVADFAAAEAEHNPDNAQIESNPYRLTRRGRQIIVSDAAANAVWTVHIRRGTVRPLAVFPSEMVETQWLKDAIGCGGPNVPPEEEELCSLPPMMPAEPVPTGVAVDADGYLYVGELKGFPAGPGTARIWKIHPSARNVDCATSDLCEVFADGFTSIVDLDLTSDGDLVVAEFDRATFLAAENMAGIGGAVSVCDVDTAQCSDLASGLNLLTAVTVGRNDRVFAAVWGLVPGSADIVRLGRA